jgi:hypothetical protein
MNCAATDCDNVAVDLIMMGTRIDEWHRRIEAEFALCSEHGALVAAIGEEIEPRDFPTFWMSVRMIQID